MRWGRYPVELLLFFCWLIQMSLSEERICIIVYSSVSYVHPMLRSLDPSGRNINIDVSAT